MKYTKQHKLIQGSLYQFLNVFGEQEIVLLLKIGAHEHYNVCTCIFHSLTTNKKIKCYKHQADEDLKSGFLKPL